MLAEYLSSMKIFEALTDSEIESLAGIALHRNVEKNAHLFHMSEEMTSFFFVVSGNVKIYRIDEKAASRSSISSGSGRCFRIMQFSGPTPTRRVR